MTNPPESLDGPALRVRATWSGIAPGKWERKSVVVFQAAWDDSGNAPDQDVFVLAGVVAHAKRWIEFTQQWDAALREPPGAEYFKFTEAMSLGRDGQFSSEKGWTEELRDARLTRLVNIVTDHVQGRSWAALRHEHFQRHIRDKAVAAWRSLATDSPYISLLGRGLSSMVGTLIPLNPTDPCEFHYDEQEGQDVLVHALWPQFCKTIDEVAYDLPPGFNRPRLTKTPIFHNEKEWAPLQAADMLAGATRMQIMQGAVPAPLVGLSKIFGLGFVLSESEVCGMGAEIVHMMEVFHQENPGVPLWAFNEDTAARDRKRARQGKPPRRKADR